MNRAPQVRVDGLSVTATKPLKEVAIFLPPQVCLMAELQPGETVEVHNLSTGGCFPAILRQGIFGRVQVNGNADPDLIRGDRLRVIAGERWKEPPPGTFTTCLCENNTVVEYRHCTAPVLGAMNEPVHIG